MYPTDERVRLLLDSLRTSSLLPDEIVVVDNRPYQEPLQSFASDVSIIRSDDFWNVSRARNLGWRATKSEIILFCDDDNTFEDDTISELISAIREPTVGAVAPVAYLGNTSTIWCAGVNRSAWTGRSFFVRDLENYSNMTTWETHDLPNMFCTRRSVLEQINGFDEVAFPLQREDADIACRITNAGFRTIITKKAAVHHHTGVVTSTSDEATRFMERGGPDRVRHWARARVLFHRRHSHGIQKFLILTVVVPSWALFVIVGVVRNNKRISWKVEVCRTILEGLLNGYTMHL